MREQQPTSCLFFFFENVVLRSTFSCWVELVLGSLTGSSLGPSPAFNSAAKPEFNPHVSPKKVRQTLPDPTQPWRRGDKELQKV